MLGVCYRIPLIHGILHCRIAYRSEYFNYGNPLTFSCTEHFSSEVKDSIVNINNLRIVCDQIRIRRVRLQLSGPESVIFYTWQIASITFLKSSLLQALKLNSVDAHLCHRDYTNGTMDFRQTTEAAIQKFFQCDQMPPNIQL